MASVKILLRKHNQKPDGRYALAIRVTVNRKSKFTFIGWIHEKDWDEKNHKVKSSHPNSKRLNNLIRKKVVEADDIILEAESHNKSYTAGEVKAAIKNNGNKTSFTALANEHLENMAAIGKHNRVSTEQGMLKAISEMLGEKDIMFHQIDDSFLNKLKVFLMATRGVTERTVINHYVFIRTLFNRAILKGIVDAKYYPFGKGKMTIRYPESVKIGLDESEIRQIEEMGLKIGSPMWHTRNVFLFSFYLAGIRISDVVRMKWNDITDDRLSYKMGKNNKVVSLKMPTKAIEIVNAYKDQAEKADDFIFPELKKANLSDTKDVHAKIRTATKKFNKYLKKIGEELEIDKKITTHIARHSFGNIAGDKVSPQMLQKLYRHTSINTTIGYQGNFIHKDADDALDSVLDF